MIKRSILFIFISLAGLGLAAQEWEIYYDVSFAPINLGFQFQPVDMLIQGISAYSNLGTYSFRAGIGSQFTDNYYFLIPEKEASLYLVGGIEMAESTPGGFSPGGAAVATDVNRQFSKPYVAFEVSQILLGDRRHEHQWLSLSLGDRSMLIVPQAIAAETTVPESFFTHSPSVRLDFSMYPEDPYWDVLGIQGSASTTLEAGHSTTREAWAFQTGQAQLEFRLPLIFQYLYLNSGLKGQAFIANYTPQVAIPAWYYANYSPYRFKLDGFADLKSRFLRSDDLIPLALCLGVGGRAHAEFNDPAAFTLESVNYSLRAFVEFQMKSYYFIPQVTMQVGVSYDINKNAWGMLFEVR